MAGNAPVQALAACKKPVATAAEAHRFGTVPVRVDPPVPPGYEPRERKQRGLSLFGTGSEASAQDHDRYRGGEAACR